jgi:polysaccharide pyruvyl transferase WcaK-like protein
VILRDGSNPEDDYSASERLCAAHPSLVLAPAFATPSEAKTYIAGMDFFMGARMHSCIAAFSSGVPVIPMAYSRKFAGLFGSLGYDETVDCTAEAGEAILDRIIRGFEDRANLKLGVERALTEGLQKLDRYEDALAGLLARL